MELRNDTVQLLNWVEKREHVLKQIREAVDIVNAGSLDNQNPYNAMGIMGKNLFELTNALVKQMPPFLNKLNQNFDFVRVDKFVFQGSDYVEVAKKETHDICSMLGNYDIFIK
jgi:hypothetical protein